jgi:hypothetical protein
MFEVFDERGLLYPGVFLGWEMLVLADAQSMRRFQCPSVQSVNCGGLVN